MKTRTKNYTVSNRVLNQLPEELIQYLWKLADKAPADKKQMFLLKSASLTETPVQDVLHGRVGMAPERHRVFGFEPVTCSVCVMQTRSGYHMFCEGEQMAA